MPRVLCNAIVEVLKPATPQRIGHFKVEVWGKAPYDYVRTYEIMAKNDTIAAQQGIARFVKEMEEMPVEGDA
jgi:hypothetical protein